MTPEIDYTRACPRLAIWLAVVLLAPLQAAAGLPETIAAIKPSVVGIASWQQLRAPPVHFFGTGFAVGDGTTIVTNAHVILHGFDAQKDTLAVLVGQGTQVQRRDARVVNMDRAHDLALLAISGPPLPALRLGDSERVREGQALAFTGYPLAMALGLHAATHRATLAAIAPIVRPSATSKQLNPAAIARTREGAFTIFQLDGVAYPGNSGSPLYDVDSGDVVGIINMVFVKGSKENAISAPSGISYAIPAAYIQQLLRTKP